MKTCMKCGIPKPLDEYYKHPKMADGRLNKCKECTKKDVKKNRDDNGDHYRDYDKQRALHPDRVKAREVYAKGKGKEKADAAKQRYIERNPKKRAAHIAVGNALRDGHLAKQPCEKCGSLDVHAHHDDYDEPLTVRFLCPKHHQEWHDLHGEGLNPE